MNIIKSENDNVLTLKVEGRLDTTTVPQLESELVIAENISTVILDFSNLEYISSAGLRVLLSTQKVMNKQGKLIIKNVCEAVKDVFDITGFSDILTIE